MLLAWRGTLAAVENWSHSVRLSECRSATSVRCHHLRGSASTCSVLQVTNAPSSQAITSTTSGATTTLLTDTHRSVTTAMTVLRSRRWGWWDPAGGTTANTTGSVPASRSATTQARRDDVCRSDDDHNVVVVVVHDHDQPAPTTTTTTMPAPTTTTVAPTTTTVAPPRPHDGCALLDHGHRGCFGKDPARRQIVLFLHRRARRRRAARCYMLHRAPRSLLRIHTQLEIRREAQPVVDCATPGRRDRADSSRPLRIGVVLRMSTQSTFSCW